MLSQSNRPLTLKPSHCLQQFGTLDMVTTKRQRGRPASKPGQHQYNCGICSSPFSDASHYSRHKRTVHSNEKKFKCGICGKSYSRSDSLRKHRKLHQKTPKSDTDSHKPQYQCGICPLTFGRASHCSRHKQTVHSNEKKFKCDICGKSFSRSDYLQGHRKLHHPKSDDGSTRTNSKVNWGSKWAEFPNMQPIDTEMKGNELVSNNGQKPSDLGVVDPTAEGKCQNEVTAYMTLGRHWLNNKQIQKTMKQSRD